MYFFTSDEHYGHRKIIKLCNRPFKNITEMDNKLIQNNNEIVKENDIVIHAGDFSLLKTDVQDYINSLKGKHIFLKGSHDYWMKLNKKFYHEIFELKYEKEYIVICHYAMLRWPRSHYNSWLLFGHSHGRMKPYGKTWDIGVDNNNFYPVSFDQIKEIMKNLPNNENFRL